MVDVDILILSKDRPKYLKNLAKGINQQDGISANVLVLDNGSDEETPDIVESSSTDQMEWHYVHEEIEGFAHGVNTAAAVMPPRSIMFLINNDVQLPNPNTLRSMAAHLGNGTGIAGLRLMQSNGEINHDGTSFTEGHPFHMGRGVDPRSVDAVCALTPATTFACVAIDRELFDQLGGMNEMYRWGSEDVDFCLSAAELKWRTMTCRRVAGVHDEFGTRKAGGDTKESQLFFGKWAVTGRGMMALRDLGWPLIDACQANA